MPEENKNPTPIQPEKKPVPIVANDQLEPLPLDADQDDPMEEEEEAVDNQMDPPAPKPKKADIANEGNKKESSRGELEWTIEFAKQVINLGSAFAQNIADSKLGQKMAELGEKWDALEDKLDDMTDNLFRSKSSKVSTQSNQAIAAAAEELETSEETEFEDEMGLALETREEIESEDMDIEEKDIPMQAVEAESGHGLDKSASAMLDKAVAATKPSTQPAEESVHDQLVRTLD